MISLVDTKNQNVITIDSGRLVLRLEIDEVSRESRIKPYMASVLYALFHHHPKLVSYRAIAEVLKEHHLIVSDLTRMHRKLSEIRQFIKQLHPN